MKTNEFTIIAREADAWRGLRRYGLAWSRGDALLEGWAGIAVRGVSQVAELRPDGPPQCYALTVTPTWGAVDTTWVASADEGFVRARISSAVGVTQHELVCDLFGGGIVVPAGVVTFAIEQTAAIRRYLDRFEFSLAVANGASLDAQLSECVPLTGAAGSDYPTTWARGTVSVPSRARTLRLQASRQVSGFVVEFSNSYGDVLAEYSSGDSGLFAGGVSIPCQAATVAVYGVPATLSPIVVFGLR